MAYSAPKNSVMFQRMQNFSVAARQLAREAAAIKDEFNQEMKPGGSPHASYVNTPIATTAEFDTAVSFLTDYATFFNGTGTLANVARGLAWLQPFFGDQV